MKHHYKILLSLFVIINLEANSQKDTIYDYQDIVDKIFELQNKQIIPEHLLSRNIASDKGYFSTDRKFTKNEFDANEYLRILTHINLKNGVLLDYIFEYSLLTGGAKIYVRPANKEPLKNSNELKKLLYQLKKDSILTTPNHFWSYIEIEKSKIGCFELAVLYVMAEGFYVIGHAHDFHDRIVCDKKGIKDIISQPDEDDTSQKMSKEVIRKALKIDAKPTIEMNDDFFVVKLVTYNKHGGFKSRIITFSSDFPHRIINDEHSRLVNYCVNYDY